MLKLNSNKVLLQQLERFWQIHTYGFKNSQNCRRQKIRSYEYQKRVPYLKGVTLKYPYCVKKIEVLPNNCEMTLKHFYSLQKKLPKTQALNALSKAN